ncbi:MAG: peptidylprolyl isomerase [Candidatus Micrarchaeota archaeon]|nr:peptidylprolyl isomerase [Candidatus Micrarchaeota archaeon]MDE1848005.1 peptidylprolyl isomerase [Candidatus Micrarchaeota archaeon]MDE1864709.1 peptidylprolyl isomerase [Candidatus Micrarchaeota archaeon]
MSFKDGDFVKIEYTAWRAADNQIVYTTDEKKARESGVYYETAKYGPQLVVVGKSNVIKGLADALKGMNVSELRKVELEPTEAFGERDQNLVRVMPLSDFKNRDMSPYPGMQLDLDGVIATVKSVNGGRVLVDANHPLAGEKLIYEVRVVSKLEKEEEKVKELAESYSFRPKSVKIEGGSVVVEVDKDIEKNSEYFVNKSTFVNMLLRDMDQVQRVEVREEYARDGKAPKKV